MKNNENHLIILWHQALKDYSWVIADLEKISLIQDVSFFYWSNDEKHINISRFYRVTSWNNKSPKVTLEGENPFIAIVVKDLNPNYKYRINLSGNIGLVNTNITDFKDRVRDILGGNYVHSSDNLSEFKIQATLIYGHKRTSYYLRTSYFKGSVGEKIIFKKHFFLGLKGFDRITELFQVLNSTIRYCLIIDKATNPINNNFDEIIHILVENKDDFIAITGAKKITRSIFEIMIDDKKVFFRVQALNDNTVDSLFQQKMLNEAIKNEFYIYLTEINYVIFITWDLLINSTNYFSLKYVSEKIKKYGPENFNSYNFINSAKYRYQILDGFVRENNYRYYFFEKTSFLKIIKLDQNLVYTTKIKKFFLDIICNYVNQLKKLAKKIIKIIIPTKSKE